MNEVLYEQEILVEQLILNRNPIEKSEMNE